AEPAERLAVAGRLGRGQDGDAGRQRPFLPGRGAGPDRSADAPAGRGTARGDGQPALRRVGRGRHGHPERRGARAEPPVPGERSRTAVPAAVPGSPLGPVVVIVTAAGVPAEALSAVRAADVVYCAPGVGLTVPGAEPAPERSELLGVAERKSVVLLAADRADQAAQALVAAGARVVEQPTPPLQRAVEVMDTLRSP